MLKCNTNESGKRPYAVATKFVVVSRCVAVVSPCAVFVSCSPVVGWMDCRVTATVSRARGLGQGWVRHNIAIVTTKNQKVKTYRRPGPFESFSGAVERFAMAHESNCEI